MAVEDNVADNREAREWIDAMGEMPVRFWEVVRDHALSRAPLFDSREPPGLVAAMTDDEARRFEEHQLGAQYARLTIREIRQLNQWYLEELVKDLQRYLRT